MSDKTIAEELAEYEKITKKPRNDNLTLVSQVRSLAASKLNFGQQCIKYTIMIFNIFFMISGLAVIAAGFYALNASVANIAPGVSTGAIVLGVLVMLIAALGCMGSWKESRLLLGFYALVLLLFFLILLIVASYAVSKKGNEDDILATGWRNAGNDVRVTLQNLYTCCGLYTYGDMDQGIPAPPNPNCTSQGWVLQQPCMPILMDELSSSLYGFGVFGLIVAFVMLAGFIMSSCLIKGIAQAYNRKLVEQVAAGQAVV